MGSGEPAVQLQGQVARVRAGELTYDEVGPEVQHAVRGAWATACDEALANLDLRSQFVAEGRTRCAEADAFGRVIVTYLGERHS